MDQNSVPAEAPLDDLQALYQWANERYFEGTLTSNVELAWNSRLQASAGDARPFIMHRPWETPSLRVRLAERIKSAPAAVLNVMVHEMIHVWQIQKAHETQNPDYLDYERDRLFPGSRVGHSRYFLTKMNELNERFPELNVDSKLDLIAAHDGYMPDPIKGFVVEWDFRGRAIRTLYAHADISMGVDEDLVNNIKQVYGDANLKSVTPLLTYNATMTCALPLTKTNKIKKRKKLVGIDPKAVDSILEDEATEVFPPLEIGQEKLDPDVHEEIQASIHHSKSIIAEPFDSYFRYVVGSCPTLGRQYTHLDMTNMVLGESVPGWSDKWTEFIYRQWSEASEKDIADTKTFRKHMKRCYIAISTNDGFLALSDRWRATNALVGSFRIKDNSYLKDQASKLIQAESKRNGRFLSKDDIKDRLVQIGDQSLHGISAREVAEYCNIDSSLPREDFELQLKMALVNQGVLPGVARSVPVAGVWETPSRESVVNSRAGFGAIKAAIDLVGVRGNYLADRVERVRDRVAHFYEPYNSRFSQEEFVSIVTDALESAFIDSIGGRIDKEDARMVSLRESMNAIRHDLVSADFSSRKKDAQSRYSCDPGAGFC